MTFEVAAFQNKLRDYFEFVSENKTIVEKKIRDFEFETVKENNSLKL